MAPGRSVDGYQTSPSSIYKDYTSVKQLKRENILVDRIADFAGLKTSVPMLLVEGPTRGLGLSVTFIYDG